MTTQEQKALELAIGAMRGLYGGWRCESAIKACEEALTQQSNEQVEPVALNQVYRCKIKSRSQINREIPREKQGWWADVSAGQKLLLRQAVQADIDRCSLNAAHSKNPADYMCETHTNGSLVSKIALEYMNPEQNVFAHPPVPTAQPKVRTGDCLLTGVFAPEGHRIAPQRTWVGLDEEEIQQVALTVDWTDEHVAWNFAIGIEELLKEKNT